ncbi:hypothetical protein HPP92_001210 [Vanilla planifolia]|uniref:Pentatricopeptide repeat-containing protein n=1 Tax=Vanilla planifolia TaxID=51239 RepID=A0A835SC83_VANPL|nr:hypothetical protein HPP92_001210 [Vanilla planifolia]
MNFYIFTMLQCLRGTDWSRRLRGTNRLCLSPTLARPMTTRTRPVPRQTLCSAIYPLGHPSFDMSLELDRWVGKGNSVRLVELQNLIRDLRRRRRYKQALEVSEWTRDKRYASFMVSDHAVHLDLIGNVQGLLAAKKYFESLKARDKTEKTYGALLNCYVRERLVDESLQHFQKMKEMGMASSPLPYNDIMCLYTNIGLHEKVPSVLWEMKEDEVLPDNFSYRICINSYGSRSDIEAMEKVLDEMEVQPQIVVDWNTYSVVANIYCKAGLNEKAISAMKKAEEKLEKKNGICYNHLISLYAALGKKQDMWRLWELQKQNCKKFINRDYNTMLRALVKLGELEEAETLLKDWESSGNSLDFRVPNILLITYRQSGLMDKAQAMMDDFLKKRKSPPSSSWGIVATGFAEKGEMGMAYEFMTSALCVYTPSSGWEPNSNVIRSILHYLSDVDEIKKVENFIGLLKNVIPMNRDMYHTLIKCNLKAGRGVEILLEDMKADGVLPSEETLQIIASFKSENAISS